MGGAILKGYKTHGGEISEIAILDPYIENGAAAELEIGTLFRSHDEIPSGKKFSTIVLATKPQVFEEASRQVADILDDDAVVISIMAGVTSDRIKDAIGKDVPIVRCMPNMAAAVQKSVNVAFVTDAPGKTRFEDLFAGSGPISWVENEDDIHATTAVSGSGPAYFFAFVEALGNAGKEAGLDAQFALELAIDTAIGAAELLVQDRNPTKLRESVTSKGGTTAAALGKFASDGNLNRLVQEAVFAAQSRSKEL